MQPAEIYLAKFPFGDVPGMKIRPVLLLTDPVGGRSGDPGRLHILRHSLTAFALRRAPRSDSAGIPLHKP
jgi:hypothetical protein